MIRARWAVVAVVALPLVGCGSATKTVTVTSGSAPASSSTGVRTSSSANRSAPPLHVGTFRSPSGNIGCTIVAELARCDIQHRSWSPGPRPATCPHIVDYGQGLEVGVAGAGRLVCAGDTAMVPTAPKLAYGRSTAVGPYRCVSYTSGMNCRNNSTGHGFFVSIQSFRVF